MKKNHSKYNMKDFELKLFTSLLSGVIVLTAYKIHKNNSQGEINIIKSTEENTMEEKEVKNNINKENYTYTELEPISSDYYRSIEINERIINFLNNQTNSNNEVLDEHTDELIISEDGVYPEGYFDYLDMKEHTLNFKTVDEAISFYSKVFELNEDISSEVIKSIVNNEEYNLKDPVVINDTEYNTYEEGISRILRDLSKTPDNYGYSEDEVRSNNGYELDYYYAEELIYKFSNVLEVNPYTALAISYGECGRDLSSYLFINNHNPGGIVSGNGFAKYRNEAVGLYEYVRLLHDRYLVGPESDYKGINGYSTDPTSWKNLVGGIYNDLCENGYGSSFYRFRKPSRDLIYCDEEEEMTFYNSKYYTLKKDEN